MYFHHQNKDYMYFTTWKEKKFQSSKSKSKSRANTTNYKKDHNLANVNCLNDYQIFFWSTIAQLIIVIEIHLRS